MGGWDSVIGHSDHERDSWDPVILEHTVWSDHVTHTTECLCLCVCRVCVPYAVART